MLRKRRHSLVIARRAVIEGTTSELDYDHVNMEIRFLDRMMRELDRIQQEKGWRYGQLQQ
jgi:hypothetical protein